jgi:class 3 adenylate cyclase
LATETLAFLFTDIEGSTALLQRIGDEVYSGLHADRHQIIRSGLATREGREVGSAGDGLFAVFSSPRACVAAVVEMQRSLAANGRRWRVPGGAGLEPGHGRWGTPIASVLVPLLSRYDRS